MYAQEFGKMMHFVLPNIFILAPDASQDWTGAWCSTPSGGRERYPRLLRVKKRARQNAASDTHLPFSSALQHSIAAITLEKSLPGNQLLAHHAKQTKTPSNKLACVCMCVCVTVCMCARGLRAFISSLAIGCHAFPFICKFDMNTIPMRANSLLLFSSNVIGVFPKGKEKKKERKKIEA